jgi:hypothetical protein
VQGVVMASWRSHPELVVIWLVHGCLKNLNLGGGGQSQCQGSSATSTKTAYMRPQLSRIVRSCLASSCVVEPVVTAWVSQVRTEAVRCILVAS